MLTIILQSSPNRDGLTAACAAAAQQGAVEGGSSVEMVRLNDLEIHHCRACNNGWGSCLAEHGCDLADDFQPLHQRIIGADAIIIVTPVYWGEMSESAKALTDRLRRCEATRAEGSYLAGKRVIAIAAAGGSGGGTVTCLMSIEHWAQHVRARIFDLIPVTRWSRTYKLDTICAAARAMVEEWHNPTNQSE